MRLMLSKNDAIRKGFSFGKLEHKLERWTNMALAVTIILFLFAFYRRSWFIMYFVLGWLVISYCIHLVARLCHRRERRWHNLGKKL